MYLWSSIESQETDDEDPSPKSCQRNWMTRHVIDWTVSIESTFSSTNYDTTNLNFCKKIKIKIEKMKKLLDILKP